MARTSLFDLGPEGLNRLFALGKEQEDGGSRPEAGGTSSGSSPDIATERLGSWVGRYRLLRILGEGGMGIVYLAEQEHPIERQVALKVIKPGMDSRRVIARFEAERQTLARLDHPNIAHVHDAGTTESGRPYFVMEYVEGLPITEYCDRNKLSIKDRLCLFMQVCQAIHHAHQKGFIHRDIKPSNILVTGQDGHAAPKVIDFGVARALSQSLTQETLFTQLGQLVGTPEYMSPEQVDMADEDIDVRSDVYSLGVLLYVLLTGALPFDTKTLRESGIEQIRKTIRETFPKTPSTRLIELGEEARTVAESRRTEVAALAKRLHTELEWIPLKAIEKDCNRRYQSAAELAGDVRHYLDGVPLLAGPPSTSYRMKKFLLRHQVGVTAGTLLTMALVCLLILSAGWYRDRIQLSRTEAFTHRNILSEARDLFSKRDLVQALRSVRAILDSAHVGSEAQLLYAGILVEGRHPDEAVGELKKLLNREPQVAGAAHALLARLYWESDLTEEERSNKVNNHRQKARDLLPDTPEAYFLRALTTNSTKEKLQLLNRALERNPGHYESRKLRAYVWHCSQRYEQMRDDAFALVVLRPQEAAGYILYGIALRELGKYEEAVTSFGNALARASSEGQDLIDIYSHRRETYMRMERYEAAIADAQQCVALSNHDRTQQFHLFCALFASGYYDSAEALYREALSSETWWFWRRCAGFVYDVQGRGQDLNLPPGSEKNAAFLPILANVESRQSLTTKARRAVSGGFHANWSPDGQKLVYCTGVHGTSGIASFDLQSQEIELLTVPGRDPVYSPDGQHITYVRDHEILPLVELTGQPEPMMDEVSPSLEIWVMNSDGTDPRLMAKGKWPHWSQDSRHVFFCDYPGESTLRSISISRGLAEAETVATNLFFQPQVSPNGKYVACGENNTLRVLDLSTQQPVCHWTCPFGLTWTKAWAPQSDKLVVVSEDRLSPTGARGLWMYDLNERTCKEMLSSTHLRVGWVSGSPDGRQLAMALSRYIYEVWIIELQSLGPGQSIEEHCRDRAKRHIRLAQADPENAPGHRFYAECYRKAAERQVSADENTPPDALRLGVPVNLGPVVNSPQDDRLPAISADGLELVFSSSRPGGSGGHDLWMSRRVSPTDPWATPVNLGPRVNSSDDEFYANLSTDGLTLYFSSSRPGGLGMLDIWMAHRPNRDGNWSVPVNVGATVNSTDDDQAPVISADGLKLFFSSSRYGDFDIWVVQRPTQDSIWSTPTVLQTTVNSIYAERSAILSADERWLVFESNRRGGYPHSNSDIYASYRKTPESEWSHPTLVSNPATIHADEERPCLSRDGHWVYFSDHARWPQHAGRLAGGCGGDDLWQAEVLRPGDWEPDSDVGPPNIESSACADRFLSASRRPRQSAR